MCAAEVRFSVISLVGSALLLRVNTLVQKTRDQQPIVQFCLSRQRIEGSVLVGGKRREISFSRAAHINFIGKVAIRYTLLGKVAIHCIFIGKVVIHCTFIGKVAIDCTFIGKVAIHCTFIGKMVIHCTFIGKVAIHYTFIDKLANHCTFIGKPDLTMKVDDLTIQVAKWQRIANLPINVQ